METPPRKKRRRRKKQKPRDHRLRNTLLGGLVVLVLFGVTGALTLYEQKLEEEERARAAAALRQATPRPVAGARRRYAAKGTPVPPEQLPFQELKDLPVPKIGMTKTAFTERYGAPSATLGKNRFFFAAHGMEVSFRAVNGQMLLSMVKLEHPERFELPPGLDLPGIELGAPPAALKTAFPGASVRRGKRGSFTLYDPKTKIAVDFTPRAITGIRLVDRLDPGFLTERAGPASFNVTFDQAFDSQAFMTSMLTDSQIAVSLKRPPGVQVPAHQVEMRLKVDAYDPDQLRAAIKRRMNDRIAAGDLGVVIDVRDRQGQPIAKVDWYSPRYAEQAGVRPARVGTPDSLDNMAYRWF